MVRTQIYLTEEQRNELIAMSRRQGKRQSELIREAVDRFIENSSSQRRQDALSGAAGIWKDRDDLPDFGAVRAGWDRV
ncbi:MAG: ribbon-helix-helix domain-containing protein [Gammaproteobacteria bacterium]|nr:ribbon-helix-helix domain-containing protein [Gammaproteobacteria bacterium]